MTAAVQAAWLPPGKQAAVCLSVDDVHPTAADGAHAVGEVARRALAQLQWLLERHPQLLATLFTTPDWRSRGIDGPSGALTRLPLVRGWIYGTRPLRRGTLRVDRHPPFAELLRSFDRTDIGLHGLHHVRRGPLPILEFSGRTTAQCRRMLREGQTIMAAAGLRLTPGFAPPAWAAPLPLLRAMVDVGMRFVTSARDLHTPVAPGATAHGSGLQDVPLFAPHLLRTVPLVHIPTNFQATSPPSRAVAIVAQGGLLSVKAHLLKQFGSYEALDGLDRAYVEYLDRVFGEIEDRFGDAVWWTSMSEITSRVHPVRTAVSAA